MTDAIASQSPASERALLDAARRGDEDAYRRLVEPHQRELHAYCYRMLGSVHDAEDALQDALLRAWRGLARFAGRSSLRSWLYRIATNACLDVVARRPKRVLPIDYEPLEEPVWIEPYPDAPEASYEQREGVELAFIVALQHLAPNQRAALILRDVLGFSAREAAEALETTVASVNSALRRARQGVGEKLPEQSQQATLRALGDERLRAIVERYTDAMERADVDAVVALLSADATWSMPPYASWYGGHESIAAFLVDGPFTVRWRHVATRANGQPAVGCYSWAEERGAYVAAVLDVLTLRGERIAAVTAFVDPGVFVRFGLPPELPG
jgi:RNA polymerase sigma-70 factor (ECF subfamily)